MKKVLITGITGQDGSYMAEYCLALGHKVFGMVRRTSQIHDKNFKHLYEHPNFTRVYGDLLDSHSLESLVQDIQPDYFINFAAQSFVGVSWQIPEETFMAGAVGVLKCLEAIRKRAPKCRFYNAGSSEQFGNVAYVPQDEKHPFRPRSPYGAAKCAAHHLVKVYRESYGIYAVQGLLFNHESERRGEEFVTRKITKGVARIVQAIQDGKPFEPIRLGNLDAQRDWSHAFDFVDGVWRMLNQETYNASFFDKLADETVKANYNKMTSQEIDHEVDRVFKHNLKEYVLSSNETHTVAEFLEIAFNYVHIPFSWMGEGKSTELVIPDYVHDMINLKSWVLVKVDPQFYRPAEVEILQGDSSAARKELGWKPEISLDKLVKLMLDSDLNELGIRPQPSSSDKEASEKACCQGDCACHQSS